MKNQWVLNRFQILTENAKDYLPGLSIVAAVTLISVRLQSTAIFSKVIPLSSLLLAIIIGMLVRNTVSLPDRTHLGFRFSSKRILRLAIIFLGFKLSLSQLEAVGPAAVATILIVSTTTLMFTVWLGRRLNLSNNCALLIASGISICGASAIAAVDGVIRSKEEDTAFAIAAITIFGTIFMFLYPVLYQVLHLPDIFYALWAGTSIHEVAQVAAVGTVTGNEFKEMAATVKMIRVLYIIPVTVLLSFFQWEKQKVDGDEKTMVTGKKKISIPWFALLFFAVVLFNSFAGLSQGTTLGLVNFDNWLMTAAMAGLGLEISLKSMAGVDKRAFVLGTVSSLFISVLSAGVIYLFMSTSLIIQR